MLRTPLVAAATQSASRPAPPRNTSHWHSELRKQQSMYLQSDWPCRDAIPRD